MGTYIRTLLSVQVDEEDSTSRQQQQQVLAAMNEQHTSMVEAMTVKFQAVENRLQSALTTKDTRIAELETQLNDAVKDKNALSVDQLAMLTMKDVRITQLETPLADAVKDKAIEDTHHRSRIHTLEEQLQQNQQEKEQLMSLQSELVQQGAQWCDEKLQLQEQMADLELQLETSRTARHAGMWLVF